MNVKSITIMMSKLSFSEQKKISRLPNATRSVGPLVHLPHCCTSLDPSLKPSPSQERPFFFTFFSFFGLLGFHYLTNELSDDEYVLPEASFHEGFKVFTKENSCSWYVVMWLVMTSSFIINSFFQFFSASSNHPKNLVALIISPLIWLVQFGKLWYASILECVYLIPIFITWKVITRNIQKWP